METIVVHKTDSLCEIVNRAVNMISADFEPNSDVCIIFTETDKKNILKELYCVNHISVSSKDIDMYQILGKMINCYEKLGSEYVDMIKNTKLERDRLIYPTVMAIISVLKKDQKIPEKLKRIINNYVLSESKTDDTPAEVILLDEIIYSVFIYDFLPLDGFVQINLDNIDCTKTKNLPGSTTISSL